MDSMIQAVLQATFVSKCVLALLLCMSVVTGPGFLYQAKS